MARADGTDNDAGAVDNACADAPDTRLTELLRTRSTTAYPALQELRARHRPAVLAYARLCTTSDTAARQLAAHAFAAAAREAASGTDPETPVRHRLLLLAGQVAAEWTADERAAGLDPHLLPVLRAAGSGGPVPPLLRAFASLPPRVQGLVWYGPVEREPEERTALLLGLNRTDVTYGTEPALAALARAALRTRLADSDDPDCQDFRRLIEESVRPDSPRHSSDLAAHMAHCPHCTAAYEDQCALRDSPRTALAEGLLPWAGTAYANAVQARALAAAADGTGRGVPDDGARPGPEAAGNGHRAGRGRAGRDGVPGGTDAVPAGAGGAGHAAGPGRSGFAVRRSGAAGDETWPASRRLALASAALGVALVPLLVFLLAPGETPVENAASHALRTPPPAPRVTVTTTVSVTPSPSPSVSPSPSRTRTSPSPTPTPTPTPSPSRTSARPKPSVTPRPPAPPAPHPPNGTFAPVVNVATGRCLDVDGGWFDKGVDVLTASCSGSATQLWRYDSGRQVLQSYADQDYCLDSRGDTDRGVGIWECDSVYGDRGVNLMFSVDGDGRIRPYIDPDTAVTAGGDDGVWLDWIDGDDRQRWLTGASA
ncbi:ricin-type beta-trefoil lectin domain protein [Streptomyces sp. NPDC093094]|uniref:ricin-type beta-trefoil lectin domain protein n=1 Tax=Streptomyces sp. NPDC093094 TaxID=3366026 RepID=UPI003802A9A4